MSLKAYIEVEDPKVENIKTFKDMTVVNRFIDGTGALNGD